MKYSFIVEISADLDGKILAIMELINKMIFKNLLIHFHLIISLNIRNFGATLQLEDLAQEDSCSLEG
jgi:hypothetical protein